MSIRLFQVGLVVLGFIGSISAAELSTRDLDAFFDGFAPMIKAQDITGALVVVTCEGHVICSKAYGQQRALAHEPIDTATSMRIGSLSKIVTCTAAMKLVEEGKLELHRDINDYLDFKIHHSYPEPITLQHLMTHTAGFEQVRRNSVVSRADQLTSLREYLIENQPERIFPPGKIMADSDYGICLVGYIIERVAKQSFHSYVQEYLLEPLGMNNSQFEEPVAMVSHASKVLNLSPNRLDANDLQINEYWQTFPAEAMVSSANDLTKFMQAHLGYADPSFLKPKTLELMHAQAFSVDPHIMGMSLGFFETTRHGHYILTHLGDAPGLQAQLSLIPSAQVGFLVLMQSQAGKEGAKKYLRSMLWKQFLNRYFPDPPVPFLPSDLEEGGAKAGFYMNVKRSESSFLHALDILGTHQLIKLPDGTITFSAICDYNAQPKVWHPLAPGLYGDAEGRGHLLFRLDEEACPMLFSDVGTFQASAWYETKSFSQALLFFSSFTFILTLLAWPIGKFLRYHYHRPLSLSLEAMHGRHLARLACLYNLSLIAGWFFMFQWVSVHPSRLNGSLDSGFYLLELLSLLSLATSWPTLVNVYQSWLSRRSWLIKMHDLSMFLATLALLWLLFIFNMVHLNVQY